MTSDLENNKKFQVPKSMGDMSSNRKYVVYQLKSSKAEEFHFQFYLASQWHIM